MAMANARHVLVVDAVTDTASGIEVTGVPCRALLRRLLLYGR